LAGRLPAKQVIVGSNPITDFSFLVRLKTMAYVIIKFVSGGQKVIEVKNEVQAKFYARKYREEGYVATYDDGVSVSYAPSFIREVVIKP
jgi:hypothetical protein